MAGGADGEVRAGVGGVVKAVAYTPVASEDYVAFKDALDESLQAVATEDA